MKKRNNCQMQILFYLKRIINNRVKKVFIVLLLIMPSLEIIQYAARYFKYKSYGAGLINPAYATFLSCNTNGHIFQIILLWFLPLFTLIIAGEDTIEDYKLGYANIVSCRIGSLNYYKTKLMGSFMLSFSIMFISLVINMGLVYAFFRNGTYIPIDPEDSPENLLYCISNSHPFAANIMFIFVTALLAGLISAVGVAVSIIVHDRKIVYAVTFVLWFAPTTLKTSLLLVMQPFSEYDFDYLLPIFIIVVLAYSLIIAGSIVWSEFCRDID